MSFKFHVEVLVFHHFDESVSKLHIVQAIKPNWTIYFNEKIITEVVRLLTDIACALSKELSSWDKLSLLFLYEVRAEFVIST